MCKVGITADCSNGMTVKQLKDMVRDWPEQNDAGEDNEVWVGSIGKGFTNQVVSICPLNLRYNENGNPTADILLETD